MLHSHRSASRLALVPLAIVAWCAGPLVAQGGGFTAGDMYLFSASLDAPSGPSIAGLVHVDLSAGTAHVLIPVTGQTQGAGSVVFDPYRQRILFDGTVPPEPTRLWAVDAAGNLEALSTNNASLSAFAPTGDGRVYFHATGSTTPFRYLDANNDVQVLLDETGTVPFAVDGNTNFDFRGMIYDAGTNALIIAPISTNFCAGGVGNRVNIRKLPLSVDGTRVVGPVTCAQFEVSTSGESAAGLSHGPGGQIVLVVDTNSNSLEPRMLLVDPVTLDIVPFASNEHSGAAATNAGTWCSALGQVVILNTLNDHLRAFSAGESGAGTILALDGSVSSTGGSAEPVSLVEVPPTACSGAWMAYGSGLAGAGGFVPRFLGAGCPEIGGTFTLSLDRAVGGASGVLFIGLSEAAVPLKGGIFQVGTVLVAAPLAVGGAPGVPGAGAISAPASLPSDPILAGVDLFLQTGFMDAGAVQGVSLTKGLRMTVGD